MGNLNGFDATQYAERQGFDPLPAGEYVCVVSDSELKPTAANTGTRLVLTLEVIDGQYKGRKLWEGFNMKNPNAEAVRISGEQLADLCRAIDVPRPDDSSALHGRPFTAVVKLKKSNYSGEMENVVSKYKSTGTAAAASVTTENANKLPWQK